MALRDANGQQVVMNQLRAQKRLSGDTHFIKSFDQLYRIWINIPQPLSQDIAAPSSRSIFQPAVPDLDTAVPVYLEKPIG
jgi:hypothetical protein